VTDRELNKVNLAIRRGLARCRGATAPIVSLSLFLEELRRDPAWTREDIRVVEAGMRHVLAQVVERDRNSPGWPF
jgi:chemotaxis signal transduction protein